MMHSYFWLLLVLSFIADARYHNNDILIHRARSTSSTEERHLLQKQILNAHNAYRKKHCVSEVVLDEDLNRSAQKYADELAKTNIFDHSDQDIVGENLYMKSSTKEIQNFDGQSFSVQRRSIETVEFHSRSVRRRWLVQ